MPLMIASSFRLYQLQVSNEKREVTYVLLGMVGNTDCAGLGLGQLGHGCTWRGQSISLIVRTQKFKLTLPCVDDRDAVIDDDIAIGLVSSGKRE